MRFAEFLVSGDEMRNFLGCWGCMRHYFGSAWFGGEIFWASVG